MAFAQFITSLVTGSTFYIIGEMLTRFVSIVSPLFQIFYYIFILIGYFINVFISSIGFIFIVIQDFFLSLWGYLQQIIYIFTTFAEVWGKIIDIFYTVLGYITGIIAFIFEFAETGGEDIFSS